MSYGGPLLPPDPFWSSVVLMTNFDGANGATTFTEGTGKTLTAVSGAALSTAVAGPVGIASALNLNGTSQYVTTPDDAGWNFGAGEFTIEAWVRPTADGAPWIVSQSETTSPGGGGVLSCCVLAQSAPRTPLGVSYDAVGTSVSSSGGSMTLNAWNFLSYTRSVNTWRIHLAGVQQAGTVSSITLKDLATVLAIGARVGNGGPIAQFWQGQIGPVRITKGIARYGAASYTPPTTAFPNY